MLPICRSVIRSARPLLLILILLTPDLPAIADGHQTPAGQAPDISTVPQDLFVPPLTNQPPGAGLRVRLTAAGYTDTEVYHTLYLPTDWMPGQKYPVIVEYPGNGPYENRFGDTSSGLVDDCCLGYGISGGTGFLWVCLPCISHDQQSNQRQWWGDVPATLDYCETVVADVCRRYGGDSEAVYLAGFSRGSIACNYLGLHNDQIAGLWRGFICHSHYDGVRTWNYPGSDRAAAVARLDRLNGRPQFISHEQNIFPVRDYLQSVCPDGPFTVQVLPYRNHTASWALRPTQLRTDVRRWLQQNLPENHNWAVAEQR